MGVNCWRKSMAYFYGWFLESLEERFNQIVINPKTKELEVHVDDEKQRIKKCNQNSEMKREVTGKCNNIRTNNNVQDSKKYKTNKSEENHHIGKKQPGNDARIEEQKEKNEKSVLNKESSSLKKIKTSIDNEKEGKKNKKKKKKKKKS